MRFVNVVAGAGIVLLAGCRYQAPPVPLPVNSESVRTLAGSWEGMYVGSDARKTGRMTLTMRVADDSAYGEVLMEQPSGRALKPDDEPAFHQRHASSTSVLAVKFLPAPGGEVSGALEPFLQPECFCTATTIFTGRIVGDTVRGTFETRGATIGAQNGKWWAARKVVIVTESPAIPPSRDQTPR